jgi:hypothetical protein
MYTEDFFSLGVERMYGVYARYFWAVRLSYFVTPSTLQFALLYNDLDFPLHVVRSFGVGCRSEGVKRWHGIGMDTQSWDIIVGNSHIFEIDPTMLLHIDSSY